MARVRCGDGTATAPPSATSLCQLSAWLSQDQGAGRGLDRRAHRPYCAGHTPLPAARSS